MEQSLHLPRYTSASVKNVLLRAGASGTIYSLVMPETEQALCRVTGLDPAHADAKAGFLSMYREAWTNKQDDMHEAYFETWFDWASPVITIDRGEFPHHYPTAGASEGIFKILAEHAMKPHKSKPRIHIFEGEYEGFPAYASSLNMEVVRHQRQDWKTVASKMSNADQFWISQPSAIDGMVWPHFEEFAKQLAHDRPESALIPDLTYVGSVARSFSIDLNHLNIPSIIFSHSKPFGGYYHRVGGVISRKEHPSLFGSKWFKNLLSLRWATDMMQKHDVHALPLKYRAIQQKAVKQVAAILELPQLVPADVNLLSLCRYSNDLPEIAETLRRGSGHEEIVRLCVTPAMAVIIDPEMAPLTMQHFQKHSGST